MRMSATYRNIFSLLQHSCALHPLHQAWDFCDTLGEFTHTELFQATQQQKTIQTQRALMPMRVITCPTPLPGVCIYLYPPTFQERCQSKRLGIAAHPKHLLPGAHPFNQYVKSSVVATLNINLQGRGLPFIPFHTFCLSKMIMVTLKYYQQGNYRCWYFSLQNYFPGVLIRFIMLPKSVEFFPT